MENFKHLLFKTLARNIDIGVAVVDKEGFFVYYNETMGKIEGLSRQDVIGKHIYDIYPSFDDENSTINEALKTGKASYNNIQRYINKQKKQIISIVSDIPINVDGKTVGVIEISRDYYKEKESKKSVNKWLSADKKEESEKVSKHKFYEFSDFITADKKTQDLLDKVMKISKHGSNVLIYGETGVGKEIVAQAIHAQSDRLEKPFIAQNCAAIPENLLESILFGTTKGSFTGAIDKEGLFELADGGTLLLDELNSLPIFLQAKLLRVLQENKIRRIGAHEEKTIDVRVIATINENPTTLIEQGKLRKDLYFRLSTLYVFIPPLRKRKDDIFILKDFFMDKFSIKYKIKKAEFSQELQDFFTNYTWDGNVRELINVLEYLIFSSENNNILKLEHLPHYLKELILVKNIVIEESDKVIHSYADRIDSYERRLILAGLEKNNWNVSKTALDIGVKRQTLQNKMIRLKLNRNK